MMMHTEEEEDDSWIWSCCISEANWPNVRTHCRLLIKVLEAVSMHVGRAAGLMALIGKRTFRVLVGDVEPLFDFLGFGLNRNPSFRPYAMIALLGYPMLIGFNTAVLLGTCLFLKPYITPLTLSLAIIFEVLSLRHWKINYYLPPQGDQRAHLLHKRLSTVVLAAIFFTLICLSISVLTLMVQWMFPGFLTFHFLLSLTKLIGYATVSAKEVVNIAQIFPPKSCESLGACCGLSQFTPSP